MKQFCVKLSGLQHTENGIPIAIVDGKMERWKTDSPIIPIFHLSILV